MKIAIKGNSNERIPTFHKHQFVDVNSSLYKYPMLCLT